MAKPKKVVKSKAVAKKPVAPKNSAKKSAVPVAVTGTTITTKNTASSVPPAPTVPAPIIVPPRDELIAPRDIGRMLRYGERFGPHRIDVRMLPLQLPVASGALAVFDPAAPKSWRVFDRPAGNGQFRVMLAIARAESSAHDRTSPGARTDDKERLAAIVIHVGRPPIAKWTVAHYQGQKKPKSPDALPRCATSGWLALVDAGSGSPGVVAISAQPGLAPVECPLTDGRRALALPCGEGEYAAYWAVDAADKPICLVVDFDVFTQKDWKSKPTSAA